MKILVVGFGSIARKHILALKAVDPAVSIIVLRQQSRDADLGEFNGHVQHVVFSMDDALALHPDGALITNPAPFHMTCALACAKAGVPLFIEKPLACTVESVGPLKEVIEAKQIPVLVGYCLRHFEPLLSMRRALDQGLIGDVVSVRSSVGQSLDLWRPGTDYRRNITARADLGGGVVMELSHELDYLGWLMGHKPTAVSARCVRAGGFDIDVEDMAEITVDFEGNRLGHVHLDFLDKVYHRECRIVGSQGTVLWQAHEGHRVQIYEAKAKSWRDLCPAGSVPAQMYEAQMRHFIECLYSRQIPAVGLEEGLSALRIILAAKQSSDEGRKVHL